MLPPFVVRSSPSANLEIASRDAPSRVVADGRNALSPYPPCPPDLQIIYNQVSARSSPPPQPSQLSPPGNARPCVPSYIPGMVTQLPNSGCECRHPGCCSGPVVSQSRQPTSTGTGDSPLVYFINLGNPVYRMDGKLLPLNEHSSGCPVHPDRSFVSTKPRGAPTPPAYSTINYIPQQQPQTVTVTPVVHQTVLPTMPTSSPPLVPTPIRPNVKRSAACCNAPPPKSSTITVDDESSESENQQPALMETRLLAGDDMHPPADNQGATTNENTPPVVYGQAANAQANYSVTSNPPLVQQQNSGLKPIAETTYYVNPTTQEMIGRATRSYVPGAPEPAPSPVYTEHLRQEDPMAIARDYSGVEQYSASASAVNSMLANTFRSQGGKGKGACC